MSFIIQKKIIFALKVQITKHDQLLPMLWFNVYLKIRFSFEFGNTHRTMKSYRNIFMVIMNLTMTLQRILQSKVFLTRFTLPSVCFQVPNEICL